MRRPGRRGWVGIIVAVLLLLLFLKMCVRIVPGGPERTASPPQHPAAAEAGPLSIPVEGVPPTALTDTFTQARAGGARPHDAIDIMAARGRAVLAAADGRIEKLFTSEDGGLTIYQRSGDGRRIYYYAHLDAYAPGLAEGQMVKRGQKIAMVGSSGNADPSAPHLHFAVNEIRPGEPWHRGRAINPYPLLARPIR
ncbi:M23 family metallopeptidase [Sphingobium sp. Cam5-1]|uniref:M23 family metallopeptidase n=1 Tax=Sphingobium sp. Cam5-1 TaxID=2789327 RepID=UPI0018AD1EF0|nr:M23 family metallopeptidase [Sphingobium sp. Cam5-1]QPI73493.1 M23 family metallopeptidase [Sphingobium sp. Cam5-1]